MSRRNQSNHSLQWVLVGLCSLLFGFYWTECRERQVPFQPIAVDRDGYRADELALLQITTENILNLERNKDYGQIYDTYASVGLKKSTSRRAFLTMGNCAEHTLGGMLYYNRQENAFTRQLTKHHTIDTIVKTVDRTDGRVQEKMAFVREGMDYKLNAFYWLTPHQELSNCLKAALNTEQPATPDSSTPSPTPQAVAKPSDTHPVQPPPKLVKKEAEHPKPIHRQHPEPTVAPNDPPEEVPPTENTSPQ